MKISKKGQRVLGVTMILAALGAMEDHPEETKEFMHQVAERINQAGQMATQSLKILQGKAPEEDK